MFEIEKLSVIALLEDLPEHSLVRGQVGTVVDNWTPGGYEVVFCDGDGQPYAMLALPATQLMRLHRAPTHRAA